MCTLTLSRTNTIDFRCSHLIAIPGNLCAGGLMLQKNYSISQSFRLSPIMCHEQCGRLMCNYEFLSQPHHLVRSLRVQGYKWLIHDQKFGRPRKGPGERQPALLSQ